MRKAFLYILLSVVVIELFACRSDDDNIETQQGRIVNYLTSRGLEYVLQDGVYKYLAYRNPAYEDDSYPSAQVGDSVYFRFAGYVFVAAPEYLFYTNNRYLVENDTILNAKYWQFVPKGVKIGDGSIIKGLDNSLLSSKEGDSLLVFLTSDLGYGDKAMGLVEKNTALMYILNIERVIK